MLTLHPTSPYERAQEDLTTDATEEQVQRLLRELEASAPEVQAAFVVRLLSGIAGKVTGNLASQIVKISQAGEGKKAPKTTAGRLGAGGKDKNKVEPMLDISLTDLNDSSDPFEAWERFGGAEGLRRILPYQPQALLERMLRNPRMPAGKAPGARASRETIAKNIIERLERYYGSSAH